jgi:ribosomal protein S18 acetylase RimI-like enzyme
MRRSFKETLRIENNLVINRITTLGGYIEVMEKSPYANNMNSILRFYVETKFRNQGIGASLIEAAKRRYSNLSAQVSNSGSFRLFSKAGFKPGSKLSIEESIQKLINVGSAHLIWGKK